MARPLKNTSKKGNAKEVRSAEILEGQGWTVGSRRHIGGAGDLLATKRGERSMLIEVKASATPWMNFRRDDRAELLEQAKRAGAVAALAHWAPRARTHRLYEDFEWPDALRLAA